MELMLKFTMFLNVPCSPLDVSSLFIIGGSARPTRIYNGFFPIPTCSRYRLEMASFYFIHKNVLFAGTVLRKAQ